MFEEQGGRKRSGDVGWGQLRCPGQRSMVCVGLEVVLSPVLSLTGLLVLKGVEGFALCPASPCSFYCSEVPVV